MSRTQLHRLTDTTASRAPRHGLTGSPARPHGLQDQSRSRDPGLVSEQGSRTSLGAGAGAGAWPSTLEAWPSTLEAWPSTPVLGTPVMTRTMHPPLAYTRAQRTWPD